jgi:hypothetical protein
MGRQGTRGVRDLGQLRPVQRTVGDHAEHPAGWQQLAYLRRGPAQPLERAVPAVADLPDLAADAVPAGAGRPGVADLDRRDRGALLVGEHDRALGRVLEDEAEGQRPGDLQGHRERPGRAVGQPAAPLEGVQVGPAEETGQRRVGAGEQQLQVGELARPRVVCRRVAQHLVGHQPPALAQTNPLGQSAPKCLSPAVDGSSRTHPSLRAKIRALSGEIRGAPDPRR